MLVIGKILWKKKLIIAVICCISIYNAFNQRFSGMVAKKDGTIVTEVRVRLSRHKTVRLLVYATINYNAAPGIYGMLNSPADHLINKH
ncbi:MAG: hypothetical protein EOO20_27385 [Chryseobacterium sp.]|nr:MAG: hypothetical protein EOO20_27385 [Chryseobacterium sp.]